MTKKEAIDRLKEARAGHKEFLSVETLNMAIKALEQEPKWIPVSERLPKKIGTYMTTVDYGRYGLATGQRFYHGSLGWEDDCVIAWQPLPTPYEPQKSEG